MLLSQQLKSKAKRTSAVRPLNLPRRNVNVKPGDVCYVAGWGKMAPVGKYSNTLQEVELTVQKDQECESYLKRYYNNANQICAGDPKTKRASFKVSYSPLWAQWEGRRNLGPRDPNLKGLLYSSFSLGTAGTSNELGPPELIRSLC